MIHCIKASYRSIIVLVVAVLASATGFSQGPGGGTPPFPDATDPAVVPFDDYLHLVIIAAGLILAFVILKKRQRKHSH